MDAIDFFLVRYTELHGRLVDDLVRGLNEAQVRGRPAPGVNTVAWLLWHMARIEDVGVNRFVAGRRCSTMTGSRACGSPGGTSARA